MSNSDATSSEHSKQLMTGAAKTITVALAGNPNCGKTTLFNNLTGGHQHVGNYAGVTVETQEGIVHHGGYRIRIIDLPGVYSLSAYSIEEVVAQSFIINEKPDVLVDIVDGSNLERNLYLPAQFAELGTPMVIALNMADEMAQKGIRANVKMLSEHLGAPIVSTVGTRNKGTKALLDQIVAVAEEADREPARQINYGEEIERELEKLGVIVAEARECWRDEAQKVGLHAGDRVSPRWLAVKLLEGDKEASGHLHCPELRQRAVAEAEASRERLAKTLGEEADMLIAEGRYGFIHGLCTAAIRHKRVMRFDVSDRIDKVLTNRVLGLPIFALLMYATFALVFGLGAYPMEWIATGVEGLRGGIAAFWPAGYAELARSLVLDGIIGGVGGVIVFLPNIMLLFLALALLEDTGYMARAAFIVDRLMKWVGLHGKSFIPMLSGFGCSVPGILGTRILDNQRDRLTTIMVLPLMSCGARLPVYALLIPAFFKPSQAGAVLFGIYVAGIVVAIVAAKLLRRFVFKGEPSPFVMELPPYRIPTAKAVLLHMWRRSWMYLRKAGTIILAFSILMWALASFPRLGGEELEALRQQKVQTTGDASAMLSEAETASARLRQSITGRIGGALQAVFAPAGFDWRISTALVGCLPAKELFVAQMGIVFSLDAEAEADGDAGELSSLQRELKATYTPLTGLCVMLYCLIGAPCLATIAATKRETNWGWALGQFFGLTLLAWLVAAGVYQVGSALMSVG